MNSLSSKPYFASAILAAVVILAGTTLITGCKKGNGRLAVSGKVTLDGKLLEEGVITFVGKGEGLLDSSAIIAKGVYGLPSERGLLPGSYAVVIDAADSSKTGMGGVGPPIPVSLIPPQYNADTILTAEVAADGNHTFDFDLKTRG